MLDPKGLLAQAGFEMDDMILAVDGQPVEGVDSLIDPVAGLAPGKRATIGALDHRTGNTGDIFVKVK